jgi:hypothetical protein
MLITFNASDFTSASIQPDVDHYESRWQVASSFGFEEGSVLFDTWWSDTDLVSFSYDFPEGDSYVRIQFRDNYGVIGPWSDAVLVSIEPPEPAEPKPLPEKEEEPYLIPELRVVPVKQIEDAMFAVEDMLDRLNMVIRAVNRLLAQTGVDPFSEDHELKFVTRKEFEELTQMVE